MAEYVDREHYIPLRKGDLVELLAEDRAVGPDEREPFQQFCRLLTAVFHFEYLDRLEKLKSLYAHFNPDSTTKPRKPLDETSRERRMDEFFNEFVNLMERANYTRLSRTDIQQAMEAGASDWGLNMEVDFDIFDRLEVFSRGQGTSIRTKKHPIFFWKTISASVQTYERLALVLKFRKHKNTPRVVDPNGIYLKLFKDIPRLDLEMVLPGTRLQMPSGQKKKMGASLLGTIAFGIYKVWSDLVMLTTTVAKGALTAASNVALGPILVLGGYGYKQYAGYQTTRLTYSAMLTESLYYQTLDNNAGVVTHLLDEAEEQEVREALLAWFCLWKKAPAEGWTSAQLDDFVELFLEGAVNLKVDFEIGDALDKVERLGLVVKSGDHYKAVPLTQALEKLDYRWDHYFEYAN